MAKYRGVLMVPTVVEFDSEGSDMHVTEQARRIASGMGKAKSFCRESCTYEPTLMEVKRTCGNATPEEMNVVATQA